MANWWASCPSLMNWQNIKTASEFFNNRHSACGPNAHENGMAALFGRAPAQANMEVICERDTQRGWYSEGGGQTAENIIADFQAYDDRVIVSGGTFNSAGYTANDLRMALNALNNAPPHKGFVIIEVAHAGTLPFNEHGVNYHFVAIVGYDETADKCLVSNGDRIPNQTTLLYQPDWLTIDEVSAAGVCSLITVTLKPETPPTPTPPPPPPPPEKITLTVSEAVTLDPGKTYTLVLG